MREVSAVDSLLAPAPRPRAFPRLRRYLRRLLDYGRLMRLDRPIGIWLLMWPMLWALWIAARGRPTERVFLVMVLGVVVMRSAGCIINDFADRNVDPHVRRTRERPLASRRVSPQEALVLFLILISLALWLVTRLDPLTIAMSCVGAALTITYPFMKRFFALPQFHLGLAFGWAVPMAFTAEVGAVPRAGWVIFCVAVLWATIYDTLYAMVDREDDLRIGVRSTAILFGDLDRLIIGAMQVLMVFALVLVGRSLEFGRWYLYGVAAAAALFAYQQWLIREREPGACFRAFLNNNYTGLAVFVGILLEYSLRP
jgi:4-hydroxybenzoate polyprenyltransferase